MSTATKLEYLNETKGLLKDNINLTGAGLTNQTPFRQYATDLKTALLNILNNGIDTLYNNFPKTTGTGTNITLNNTLQAPIRSVINGDTFQQSYSGKNLLNWTLPYTIQNAGNIILNNVPQLEVGESYYFVGKCSDGTILSSANCSCVWYSGSTQILNKPPRTTFTATDISSASGFYIYVTSALVGKTISEFMLIKGTFDSSNIPSYEPYTGGTASPNPDYPQEIKSVTGLQKVKVEGKNLLNPNANSITKNGITFTNNNGIFSISGTATANTGLSLTTDTIILENNTAYTQSVITESGTQNVNVVPAFKNSQGTIQYNYLTNNQTKTTTDKMTLYSYDVYIPNGTTVNWSFKVQLEHSSTASEYQEYQTPQEYEINLGTIELNKIDTYQDYISGTPYNWSIKRQIGTYILDGINNKFTSKHATITSETKGFYKAELPDKNVSFPNGSTDCALSNYFSLVSGTASNAFANNNSGIWWQQTGTTVYFILEETSLTNANNWLSNHNTQVDYVLEEETTEPITNQEIINQLNEIYNLHSYNGTTNITITSDNLPAILNVSAIKDE